MNLKVDKAVKMVALKRAYRRLVAGRLNRKTVVFNIPDGLLRPVAEKLKDFRLAEIFVEAQFHAMPREWCQDHFQGLVYPPMNVVFGGRCWDRFEEYSERGIRDAT